MSKKNDFTKSTFVTEETIEKFHSFFSGELIAGLGLEYLEKTYTWQVPQKLADKFGLEPAARGEPSYRTNVDLKWKLHDRWHEAPPSERLELARDVIAVWGGIPGNKDETLKRYVAMAESSEPVTRLEGVASYSKLLAIARPETYAIYDARVAVSLNAIQLLAGHAGLVFPYPPGRNNLVGNRESKKGFAQDEKYSKKRLVERGWKGVPRKHAYEEYLQLLRSLRSIMSNEWQIYDFEMALFSQVEKIIHHLESRDEK